MGESEIPEVRCSVSEFRMRRGRGEGYVCCLLAYRVAMGSQTARSQGPQTYVHKECDSANNLDEELKSRLSPQAFR